MFETKVALDVDTIHLSMPLMKVDVEKRTVHGFATLDNLDNQDDIVTKEASVGAFNRFRGNIREQHDPKKAVGLIVGFREDRLFDQETAKSYNGVFVSAYISKGAEDTWQKVLDGTLSGFSIGGVINEAEEGFTEKSEVPIRVVTEYDLSELSLVDSPANELANVVSIEKNDTGVMTMETPQVIGGIENIFWCESDGLITLKPSESGDCAMCQSKMQNVGFIESGDKQKDSVVKAAVIEFKKFKDKEAKNVAEKTEGTVEKAESPEEVIDAPVEKADKVDDEKVEKAKDSNDTVEKTEAVNETDRVIESLVSSLTKMTDAVQALEAKIDTISKSIGAVQTDVSKVMSDNTEFGKRVDAVESTTAFRKSGDLGEVVQEQVPEKEQSLWGGSFLNTSDL
jgi:phage head maturation protease